MGACKGWHNCGIFARAGSRDSVLESVCLCVNSPFCNLFALFCHNLCWNPIQSSEFQKLKKKHLKKKKKHPVVMLFLLVLGQRDPECYDFDGRGSAPPEFVGGGYFCLSWCWCFFVEKNRGFQWGLAKISKFPSFCLNQHLKASNLGEQGSVRDKLGWQWNEY